MKSNWFCKIKIAHRGLHNDTYPENSIGAFENAINQGFAIELDVRTLKDGTVVVIHDGNLKRICGVDRDVNDLNVTELKDYHLLDSEYTIPTLKEVLDTVDSRVPIMIELKPIKRKEKLEQKVYSIIKDYTGDIAVKSFNPFSMLWFRRHAPNISRGLLSSFFNDINLPYIYKSAIKKLRLFSLVKPDFISYDVSNLPNKFVERYNVPVLAWTIQNEKLEKYAMKYACNVIFENYIPKNPTNY